MFDLTIQLEDRPGAIAEMGVVSHFQTLVISTGAS
jgi:hypothetical protein